MKRVIIERTGAPAEVVRIDEIHTPGEPGPHDALLELVAAPIHPADLLTIMGRYAAATGPMPKVLGKEGLGRVVAVGPMVKHLKPGDLTPILLTNDGVWQEQHILDASGLVALPPGGDPLQYAMAIGNPATARLLLSDIVPLELGDWLVQNAANSAVGQYVIQIARRDGIRTVNVVRREGLEDKLFALGADVVLVDGPDLPQRIAAATAGVPIKVAFDAVSGEAAARLAACLTMGGTLCNYGMLSGKNVHVSPAHLIGLGIVVRGFWVTSAMAKMNNDERAKLFASIIPLVASGAIKAAIEATYPLDRIQDALAHALRGERQGKILLTR